MKKITLLDRLRYAFDNTLSKGPVALVGWLLVLSLLLIVLSTAAIWAVGVSPDSDLGRLFWTNMMQTLDPGAIDADAGSWTFLLIMLGVTFGGIFVTSTLIGILTTGIEERIDSLRKGRSRVIESNHTVILGWSEQIFSIISELVVANANRRKSCIVIMAEQDKVEMEDEIREKVGSTGHSRIVCRTGNPIDLNDLGLVSLQTARSIIILPNESGDPDSGVIKALLAITNHPARRPEPYHISTEIRDPRNIQVARMVGGDEVELVPIGDLISRIIAQTCRQSGLSTVYTELLDFDNDEIYFQPESALVGKTFGQALLAYEDSAVIGLWSPGNPPSLNPPMDTPILEGDRLIVISEDDDTIQLSGKGDLDIQTAAIATRREKAQVPEHTLILGWNRRVPLIIRELDAYVAPGSTVHVVADLDRETEIARCCKSLKNQALSFQQADTTSRLVLDELSAEDYNHVIILCYLDTLSSQEADARTLITLLHLRDIADRSQRSFSVVSEMLNIDNRNLAESTRADDFIVSDRLISLLLSQVSEHKALNAVFADIFDPDGSEIYLKPASDYVLLDRPVNFYTVVESARRQGQVAFGYRIAAHAADASRDYGVVVNPDKSDWISFHEGDKIVVLAED
ncbi:MAG: potassium transporter TrkA [Chloroflexia bacterium]|nr:potassium transporter TrkA [Chloroflexia bacterium]